MLKSTTREVSRLKRECGGEGGKAQRCRLQRCAWKRSVEMRPGLELVGGGASRQALQGWAGGELELPSR